MTLEEARTYFASSTAERMLGDIDDAASDAVDTYERTVARMGLYPSGVLSEYRQAGRALPAAQDAFNAAVNAIVQGRARDGRAALSAYRAFVAALLDLQRLNARNAAYVDADVARLLEAVFTAGQRVVSGRIRRETQELMRDLQRLNDLLRRARREELEARAQRAFDTALNVVGLVFGMVTGIEEAMAAFGVGSAVLTSALDAALGPSSPDALGRAGTSISVLTSAARDVSREVGTFSSGVTGLLGFVADCDEVNTAIENVRAAERRFRDAVSTLRDYSRHLASATSELTAARRLADGAIRNARNAARRARDVDADYRDIERSLAEIR